MQQYDTVLFDVDGTLVDSNRFQAQAWQNACARFGFDHDVDFFKPLIGLGGEYILPRISPELRAENDRGQAITAERKRVMLETYLPDVRPFPQAAELVRAFHAAGISCFIASAGTRDEIDAFLTKLGLTDVVDGIVSGDDTDHAKPEPDILVRALQQSKAAPERALYIGDTSYDIEAAKRAGVACIALRCGGVHAHDLGEAFARYDDPADLLAHLKEVIGVD